MVKTAKTFKLTHVGGHFSHFTIVSDASELAKRHKYFGRRYAPASNGGVLIQRTVFLFKI